MSNGNPSVDLVVVIDTSQSMEDEAIELSDAADAAILEAMQSCPSDLRVVWLGIELDAYWPEGTRFAFSVRQYLQGDPAVPAADYVGARLAVSDAEMLGRSGTEAGVSAKEDCAAAIVDICDHFDWRTDAIRAVFLLGDEALHGGDPQDGDDVAAADDAIAAALASGVTVFTYLGTPYGTGDDVTRAEYERLATETGGSAYQAPTSNLGGFAAVLEGILCTAVEDVGEVGSHHCCSTVMVNCGSGSVSIGSPCCGSAPPGDPDAPAFCPTLRVRIDRIHVDRSESYAFGVEGGTPGLVAEWELDIAVKGHSRMWIADVEDDTTYDLDWDYVVELVDEGSSFYIRASGVEKDFITPDDPLPGADKVFSSSNGWGIGTSGEISASSVDFDYTIHYTVSCLGEPASSTISRSAAAGAVRMRLESAGLEFELDEGALLTVFVQKLAGRGLRLRSIDAEQLVFDGHRPVQEVARRVFP